MISMLVGLACSFIEWGDTGGWHGTGLPFAQVYWDYPEASESAIDYPNPLAFVLNITSVFIVGLILMGLWFFLRRLFIPHCKKKR